LEGKKKKKKKNRFSQAKSPNKLKTSEIKKMGGLIATIFWEY